MKRLHLGALALVALAGCGGGGGSHDANSGSNTPSTSAFAGTYTGTASYVEGSASGPQSTGDNLATTATVGSNGDFTLKVMIPVDGGTPGQVDTDTITGTVASDGTINANLDFDPPLPGTGKAVKAGQATDVSLSFPSRDGTYTVAKYTIVLRK